MSDYKIYNQNNMQLLAAMADGSLHAVVTDCPYGFGKEPDAAETLKAWLDTGYHEITGGGFMGKKWDAFVPQPLFWKEVFRVLKPGGYVLAFFGTRTYDWGTLAIRLAGFEIRDCIQWIYGSGFPKSHDVSKAIDRQAGAEREVVGTSSAGSGAQPNKLVNHGQGDTGIGYADGSGKIFSLTAPATPEAQQWQGYGTALKPACELICVARKPLEGTVADNVLKHGCGAINLDGCRIEGTENTIRPAGVSRSERNAYGKYRADAGDGREFFGSDKGRFPANVIFDEEAAKVLDEQSGVSKSTARPPRQCSPNATGVTFMVNKPTGVEHTDSGGASRFFYCAKSSKADRNYGCEGFEEKPSAALEDRPTKVTNPENWKNASVPNATVTMNRNNHPTVKPIKLMRYLVRLVKTPVEGFAIADFFMGSGTTGVACMMEDIDFIGCDEDESSYKIAEARIAHAKAEYKPETQVVSPQIKLF